MLHDLKDLLGSSVLATDGEIGRVHNFLFDDRSWTVRYLVVDVGQWLNRQEVVLAITGIGQLDWAKRSVHVKFTRERVRNSPGVDTQKPVTRQQEIAMRDYFYGEQYWIDAGLGAGPPILPGSDYPVNTEEEDPHLRSVLDLLNYEVWATDGEVGHLHSFVMDEVSWHLGYLDVKAGHWLHHRSVLIPTRLVESILWARRRVNLQHTHEGI
jgi:uncharacterized protein YrrD